MRTEEETISSSAGKGSDYDNRKAKARPSDQGMKLSLKRCLPSRDIPGRVLNKGSLVKSIRDFAFFTWPKRDVHHK